MSVSVKGSDHYSPPPYPPPAPFKPSVVVVIAILTSFFSITFLLLLYAKHCKRTVTNRHDDRPTPPSTAATKNSGVRRAVIDSLPVFRFGSLRGTKDGLDCAVCLSRFEPSEVLRLLPKCKHAFHVECVDTWLDAHSTCPLCRCHVDPEDVLLVLEHSNPLQQHQSIAHPSTNEEKNELEDIRTQLRVSGRHSSAGELRGNNKIMKFILQTSSSNRRSLDSSLTKQPSTSSQIQNNQKKSRLMKSSSSFSSSQYVPRNQIGRISSFDKQRKDGRLLEEDRNGRFENRFEHRIMISNEQQQHQRWSDLQPLDLIYLRSEMIINDRNRRYPSASGSPNRVVKETARSGGE